MKTFYRCIIADPPWSFNDKLDFSPDKGAEKHYSTLNVSQIKTLPVKSLADPDGCVLALWVPSTMIREGLEVMETWGFSFRQTYVWSKKTKNGKSSFGMGRLFRQCHEIALIGINTTKVYKHLKSKSERSLCEAVNTKHSKKPYTLHVSLEKMFPAGDKLEMFARRSRPCWDTIGNEVCHGEDIRETLADMNQEQVEFEIEVTR